MDRTGFYRWPSFRTARGRTVDLVATLPAGARLRVLLVGEPNEEDRAAAPEYYRDEETLDTWSRAATLYLTRDDAWPEPVWFTYKDTGTWPARTHRRAELAVGSEGTSQVLSAGRYRLEARMPGGRVTSVPVDRHPAPHGSAWGDDPGNGFRSSLKERSHRRRK